MTTSFADLPPSVWAQATDDELDIIIAGLEAETTALDRDWILTPRQQAAEDLCTNLDPTKGHEVLYGGAAGGGKAGRCPDRAAPWYNSDMETEVLTPKGFVLIGDIYVGQQICNPDGTVARVVAVWDRGEQDFYRVTLADGSSVEAGADHLWNVSLAGNRKMRGHGTDRPMIPAGLTPHAEWNARMQERCRTVTTEQLRDLCLKEGAKPGRSNAPQLPMTAPVKFSRAPGRWPHLSPYTLGVVIGDGHIGETVVSIASADPEIIERVERELPEELRIAVRARHPGHVVYHIVGHGQRGFDAPLGWFRREGLEGARSWNKFVPDWLKHGTVEQRTAFIQGLFDTDGHMDDRGHVEYVTVSERLALDVQWMLRSLGCRATLATKQPHYTKDGERHAGRPAFRLYVQGVALDRLFHLARKAERVRPFNGGDVWPSNRVVSVEPSGRDNARCITVDNPNGLYVTDDFIVTHNSQWMLWHLYHLALRYPGFSGLLIRRTFAQLTRTHIQMSFRRFDRSLCKFNQVSKTWRFNNGSTIEFGYLDKASDVYNYDSAEYDTVCFDELTEWATPDNYLYLFSRIRTEMHLVEQGLVGHMVAATNPGRAGGAWVKARFIDFAEPMQRVDVADAESEAVTTRVFVPAKIDDNPHFGRRQYRANLMNVDAKRRKQLEDGDWDAIEGQYFDEWDRALHVREPFEIPDWWTRIRGLDWGIHNPMACVWMAFDGDGVCYVYRELYGTGMLNTIQARRINELTRPGETISYTMADPSIWTNTGNGMNTAEQYARAGLRCRKANNARVDGWARVREYLRIDETTGLPRFVVFNHCRNLIRTLPMLVHDSKNPEDLDTTGDDHIADAVRYALMSRPKVTRSPKREAATLEAEHAEAVRQRRHDRSSRSVMHPELGRW